MLETYTTQTRRLTKRIGGVPSSDLDLDAGTVQIRRALVQPKRAPRRLDTTKTERAEWRKPRGLNGPFPNVCSYLAR